MRSSPSVSRLPSGRVASTVFVGGCDGEVSVEENTSKIYVEPAAALLRAPPDIANGVGSPLFVINLCASQAPNPQTGKTLPGLESYRLYQVSRVEDGRTRYRLRLGFFTSEADANVVLATVRASFATAFTACLADEDRRFARGYLPETAPVARPRPVAVVTQASPQPAAKPVAPAVAKAVTPATAPAVAARPAPAKQPAPVVESKPTTTAPIAAKVAAPATTAKAPAVAASAPVQAAATPRPAVTDTQSMKKIAIEESAVFEMTWEPEAPPARAAQSSATQANSTGSHKAFDANFIDEIELTWDPPVLQAASPAAPVVPAAFKTEPVIKAKPVEKAPQPVVSKPVAPAQPVAPAAPAATTAKPAAANKAAAPAVAPEVKNPPVTLKAAAPVKLELESESAAKRPAPAAAASAQPFHVGKGAEIPNVSLSLQTEAAPIVAPSAPAIAASAAKPATAKPAAMKPATAKPIAAKPSQPKVAAPDTRVEPAKEPAKKEAPAKQAAAPVPQAHPTTTKLPPRVAALPDLDSTQTIRALTSDELNDGAIEKWFAIQLAVSEQPVNLDAMPHLDIFEAYRLYSVANAGSGKIMHALRLGFFREAVSAEAVAGYLKTFFAATSVLRISSAEQLRFKDAPAPKAPAPVEVRNDKVVDLNQARDRATRPAIPTVTMEVAPQRGGAEIDRSPTGAFKTGSHAARVASKQNSGSTGSHKALNPTLKPAPKAAAKSAGPATKHSAPIKPNNSATGRYRAPPKMSLQEQLLEEAREVELSESGIRRLPKNDSLLSRLVDKLKK